MARYIDIDKIIPELDKNTWQGDMLISIFENAEIEDVTPIVHSNWKMHFKKRYMKCNNCGQRNSIVFGYNYCPNCGAKMDEIDV